MPNIKQLYRINYILVIALVIAFLFSSCCTAGKNRGGSDEKKTYESIAHQIYKGEITYLLNSSRSHVICISNKKTTSHSPHPVADFFIFDISADSIIYQENSVSAAVKWIDDNSVEVLITPEIINDENQPDNKSYVFDIVKKKIIPRKDFK